MAEPSEKSEGIEKFITDVTGVDRRGTIRANRCTTCGGEATKFRADIDRREYLISGMCQTCQDSIWKPKG